MKKVTNVMLLLLAMIMIGCGEKTHRSQSVADHFSTVEKKGRSDTTDATDTTKEAATRLAKDAKEVADQAVESVKEHAVKTLHHAQEEISKVVIAQSPGDAGEKIYARCAVCHGEEGKQKALGKSDILFSQSATALAEKLKAYKSGTRNITGLGKTMQREISSLSLNDLLAVAEYISTFKNNKGR
jgi:cytochrome c553